jgi:hypothetical protein
VHARLQPDDRALGDGQDHVRDLFTGWNLEDEWMRREPERRERRDRGHDHDRRRRRRDEPAGAGGSHFVDPASRPWTKYRWKAKKTISGTSS